MTSRGSHGPSGQDANEWRRTLTHFGQASVEISKALAKIAQKISTVIISPELLEPCYASRLIPPEKIPGFSPIRIGEIIRRIIGRTITKGLKSKIRMPTMSWPKFGIEYAIHTLWKQYEKIYSNAVLLIEAEKAFNSLNRNLALKNIANICPSILPAIQNSLSSPSKHFVNGKSYPI